MQGPYCDIKFRAFLKVKSCSKSSLRLFAKVLERKRLKEVIMKR